MMTIDAMQRNRGLVPQSAGASFVLWALPLGAWAADARQGLKIGVNGSGRVGGTIGELWIKAGHEPVVVGGLARAREFDYGTPVFGRPMTAAELRNALGLKP
jgi:predicted dinucleotide-binding enzyme